MTIYEIYTIYDDFRLRPSYNFFFCSLTFYYCQQTASKTLPEKIVLYLLLHDEKAKYCIFYYFMVIYLHLLGNTKAHGLHGKMKISRRLLIKMTLKYKVRKWILKTFKFLISNCTSIMSFSYFLEKNFIF